MKVVVVTLMILAIFFTSAIYTNIYINSSADKLTDKVIKLDEAIGKSNWDEAKHYMQEVSKDWHKTKEVWQTFLEHYEIDAIDIVLARVQKYVEIEGDMEALGEIAELKLLIQHIVGREAFKLVNIL